MQTTTPTSDYELERGKPLPSKLHGFIQSRLNGVLLRYQPPCTVFSELALDLEGIRLTPDLCVYKEMPIDFAEDEVRMVEPPLLVIEIESPTQGTQELADKIRLMLRLGVQAGWLVQPALQTITVFVAEAKPKTHELGTIKDDATGIEVDVEMVFAPLP